MAKLYRWFYFGIKKKLLSLTYSSSSCIALWGRFCASFSIFIVLLEPRERWKGKRIRIKKWEWEEKNRSQWRSDTQQSSPTFFFFLSFFADFADLGVSSPLSACTRHQNIGLWAKVIHKAFVWNQQWHQLTALFLSFFDDFGVSVSLPSLLFPWSSKYILQTGNGPLSSRWFETEETRLSLEIVSNLGSPKLATRRRRRRRRKIPQTISLIRASACNLSTSFQARIKFDRHRDQEIRSKTGQSASALRGSFEGLW